MMNEMFWTWRVATVRKHVTTHLCVVFFSREMSF